MFQFMREGGYAMWFILVVGGVTLGIAVSFVVRPTERKLSVMRPMSVSTPVPWISYHNLASVVVKPKWTSQSGAPSKPLTKAKSMTRRGDKDQVMAPSRCKALSWLDMGM